MRSASQILKLRRAAVELGLAAPGSEVFIHNGAAHLSQSFTADQMAYIAERASAHGITSSDLLNLMDYDVARCPAAAIAKLRDSEISHILSQHNAPALAHDPNNLVLEVADGTNQARGAADMTVHDRIDVELRSEAQDAAILDHLQPAHASFQEVWDLFSDVTRSVCAGVFAFRYVDKSIWHKTIRLGQEIINDFPRLTDPAVRERAISKLADHINLCAGRADCHTAFLMALLLVHAPWATALLAAKGLCTLARMALSVARDWVAHIFQDQRLAWARKFFHGVIDFVDTILDAAISALQLAWSVVETAVKAVADVVSTVYRKTTNFIRSIWSGFCSIFSWGQLSPA